jgi:hypothetical protein
MDFEDCDKFVNGLWVARGLEEFGSTIGGYFGISRFFLHSENIFIGRSL